MEAQGRDRLALDGGARCREFCATGRAEVWEAVSVQARRGWGQCQMREVGQFDFELVQLVAVEATLLDDPRLGSWHFTPIRISSKNQRSPTMAAVGCTIVFTKAINMV